MCMLINSFRSVPVIFGLLIISLVGFGKSAATTHSVGGGRIGNRAINFDLDGPGGYTSEGDESGGVITFDGGKVTVQRSKLLLDGKEVAKVPENAKVVLVDVKAGKLIVTADGKQIYSSGAGH